MIPPMLWEWDGEALHPQAHFVKTCNRRLVIGQTYSMVEELARSAQSHNHFFAAITEIWHSLPDHMADQFPTAEHFRKFCLIKCGFCEHRQHVCANVVDAARLEAFVKPMDSYAVISRSKSVVNVWTAQSQALRSMSGKEFQECKTKVLDYAESLLEREPADREIAA